VAVAKDSVNDQDRHHGQHNSPSEGKRHEDRDEPSIAVASQQQELEAHAP